MPARRTVNANNLISSFHVATSTTHAYVVNNYSSAQVVAAADFASVALTSAVDNV